jgi:hypothetical protein
MFFRLTERQSLCMLFCFQYKVGPRVFSLKNGQSVGIETKLCTPSRFKLLSSFIFCNIFNHSSYSKYRLRNLQFSYVCKQLQLIMGLVIWLVIIILVIEIRLRIKIWCSCHRLLGNAGKI